MRTTGEAHKLAGKAVAMAEEKKCARECFTHPFVSLRLACVRPIVRAAPPHSLQGSFQDRPLFVSCISFAVLSP